MAALNFPISARYFPREEGKVNIASFELISFVLSGAASTAEARELLRRVNITGDSFSPELSATPLHWIVADKKASLIIESVEDGVKIYENPLGVLTNEPPFPFHTARLADFLYLKSEYPENTLSPSYEIDIYSRGMGAVGLPGDYSSSSRFVRAVFLKEHTGCFSEDKAGEASRFFHIMDSLTVPLGAVKTKEGKSVYTVYTSMIDTDSLIYYFSTYRSRSIKGVRLSDTPLDSDKLKAFSMEEDGTVFYL
jgi:choloylglycine hydrolase